MEQHTASRNPQSPDERRGGGGLLFQELGRRSAVSPSHLGLAIVMTIGAVAIVGHGIWEWAMEGKALPLALLWAPVGAFGIWLTVQSELEWSDSSHRVLTRVGIVLTAFFGVLFVYGLYAWSSLGGEPLLPLFSFVYLAFGILGWWRRGRRVPRV